MVHLLVLHQFVSFVNPLLLEEGKINILHSIRLDLSLGSCPLTLIYRNCNNRAPCGAPTFTATLGSTTVPIVRLSYLVYSRTRNGPRTIGKAKDVDVGDDAEGHARGGWVSRTVSWSPCDGFRCCTVCGNQLCSLRGAKRCHHSTRQDECSEKIDVWSISRCVNVKRTN